MAKDGSVAPRERVNIKYTSSTGDAQEDVELPLKLLMLGDYTGAQEEAALEDRQAISIDKDNFDDVLKGMNLKLDAQVENKLEEGGGDMPVTMRFESLKDFGPEAIVNQVPELKKLMELRAALTALKGPLGNVPKFRKKIQSIIKDDAAREKILGELGGGGGGEAAAPAPSEPPASEGGE